MAANPVHTEANAVPPVDDTDLGGVLEDLAGIHPAVDLMRDAIRLLAHDRLTIDQTQTLAVTIAGPDVSLISALAHLAQRLTNVDTNPALRALPLDQQKQAQQYGEQVAFAYTDPDVAQYAAEASAAITGN